MPFIAIVGAGDLGGAAAQAAAERELAAEIRLIDPAEGVAAGKALDIAQAGAAAGFGGRLTGTADLRAASGAAALVLADWAAPPGQPSREVQGEEGLALLGRLWRLVGAERTPIVCAGPAQGALVARGVAELGIDRRRVIGSAPAAFESAARAMVALALDGSPRDVSFLVLGSPPELVVPCWSQATYRGALLTSRLSPPQIARVEGMLPHLWPPGPVALGAAAADAVASIMAMRREELTCLVMLDGELGVRRVAAALPVRLGAGGVEWIAEPDLAPRERTRLTRLWLPHFSG